MNRILTGGLAGALATLPMTVAMTAMHRTLPEQERYPLPPKQILEQLAGWVELRKLNEAELNVLTMLAHVGYGAVAGALYASAGRLGPGNPAVKGVVFGLGVWTTSYLGWLPWAGILTPATEHPARRNGLMIAAHVVWGAGLGLLQVRLRRASSPRVRDRWPRPRRPGSRTRRSPATGADSSSSRGF